MTWYFTFGSNHWPGLNYYTKLRGTAKEIRDQINQTREEMFQIFGPYWSMQYDFKKGYDIVHGNNPWPKLRYVSAYAIKKARNLPVPDIQEQMTWFRMINALYPTDLNLLVPTAQDGVDLYMKLEGKNNTSIHLYCSINQSRRLFLEIQDPDSNTVYGCCTFVRSITELKALVDCNLLDNLEKIPPVEYTRVYKTRYSGPNFNGGYVSKYYASKIITPYNILDIISTLHDNEWQAEPAFA